MAAKKIKEVQLQNSATRRLSLALNCDEMGGIVYTESPILNSPLSNLALNLGHLNASLGGTPKRRISWSSVGSTSPDQVLVLNKDDGFFDSPVSSLHSPVLHERPFKEVSSALNAPVLRKLFPPVTSQLAVQACSPSYVSVGKENLPRWPSPIKEPRDEDDGNSLDSGFSDKDEKLTNFHFTEPKGLAPRRQRTLSSDQLPSAALGRSPSLQDVESNDCPDDGFQDIPDSSVQDHVSSTVPCEFSKLIKGKLPAISPNAVVRTRSPLRRFCYGSSVIEENADNTPKGRSCSRGLFVASGWAKDVDNGRTIGSVVDYDRKRPDAPRDLHSPLQNKRRKSLSFCCRKQEQCSVKELPKKVELLRCRSETEATIMRAIQLSDQEPNLIGDFTKEYVLPLIEGRHRDLKCIAPETVRQLLVGDYVHAIDKCIIVDCRYPYEFDGGHIKGALNVYTKDGIVQEFLDSQLTSVDADKRLIIVFHCEFSSERGPNLSRFLRNRDREANHDCYPHLHYPEIYLLEGGYKGFYENHKALCEPQDYKPMLHKDHEKDLRHFRAKSKSFNGDKSSCRMASRPGLKF